MGSRTECPVVPPVNCPSKRPCLVKEHPSSSDVLHPSIVEKLDSLLCSETLLWHEVSSLELVPLVTLVVWFPLLSLVAN